MKNPWLGLLSYQDPQKNNDDHVFCGRDTAISSLFAMIDNNLLVTLYGKTGIGKTSVLNAGVFPLLRSRGYLPLSIRLGKYDGQKTMPYAKCIIEEIQNEIQESGGHVETMFPEFVESNTTSTEYLWKYFCTTKFTNKDGQVIFPVIVLDQFEEIFISQPKQSSILLKQIYALLDDNREVPEAEGYSDTTNFRFVFSIREDDLFYLEDTIDIYHLAEMKQNRYRLIPLTDSEAREVIMLGSDFLEKGAEEEIIARIIRLSKDESGQISTNILSLTCCQLFTLLNGHITLEALTDTAKNPLDAFYTNCLERISESTRQYVENELVDQDRRKFVSKDEFIKKVGGKDADTLMNGPFRIIQDVTAGNRECVELIHDSLARTIYHLKTEADERARNQRLQKHNFWIKIGIDSLLGVLAISLGVITTLLISNQKFKDEKGYGVSQKISISFQEDSLIIADHELWRGSLLVIAYNNESQDTLITRKVNDEYRDSTFYISLDSAKSVRMVLTFAKAINYHPIDTIFKIGALTDTPNVKLPIRKIQPPQINYSSRVVATIEGKEYNIQEAIVIIRDKIQRTDVNGNFAFNFNDSLNNNDVIYIVKKGFACYERSKVVSMGKLPDKFEITPSDSLASYFEFECKQIESMEDVIWYYKTVSEKRPQGERAYFNDNSSDWLVFYGSSKGKAPDGRISIWGYYYLQKEYEAKGYLAYHIFSGWMEKGNMTEDKNLKFKSFEIESYDFANNKEIITGLFDRAGRLSGEIKNIGGKIAVFGPYKDNFDNSLVWQ